MATSVSRSVSGGSGEEDGGGLAHGFRGAPGEAVGDALLLPLPGQVEVGVPGHHLGEAPRPLQGLGERWPRSIPAPARSPSRARSPRLSLLARPAPPATSRRGVPAVSRRCQRGGRIAGYTAPHQATARSASGARRSPSTPRRARPRCPATIRRRRRASCGPGASGALARVTWGRNGWRWNGMARASISSHTARRRPSRAGSSPVSPAHSTRGRSRLGKAPSPATPSRKGGRPCAARCSASLRGGTSRLRALAEEGQGEVQPLRPDLAQGQP